MLLSDLLSQPLSDVSAVKCLIISLPCVEPRVSIGDFVLLLFVEIEEGWLVAQLGAV